MILPWLLVVPLAGVLLQLLAWAAPRLQVRLALMTCAVSLLLSAILTATGGAPRYAVSGWPVPIGISLQADPMSCLMLLLTGVVLTTAVAYQIGAPEGAVARPSNPVYHLAFPLLLLALNGLFVTGDVFNFYVFFELVAVTSYLLVSQGAHHALEAAWKYSAQSVFGSVLLLVGVVLLYGIGGTLSFADLAVALDEPAWPAAPFLLVAFLLKGALFPFHFWQPDAHAAATTAGSMILAGLLINVGLYGLYRFWPLIGGGELGRLLVALGAASVLFGAAAAWTQGDAKRLLGFSSISQLGFPLMALGWGTVPALAAGLYFVIVHAVAKTLLFAATGLLADRVGATRLRALIGAGSGHAGLAVPYLLGILSLAGLPPLAGFVAKIGLVQAAVAGRLWWSAAVVLLGSLLTLAYGLRAYQLLFWRAPDVRQAWPPALSAHAALGGLAGVLIAITLAAGPIWRFCLQAASALYPHGGGP